MSDFQVILFVGHPPPDEPDRALEVLMSQFHAEHMLTPLHCDGLGENDETIMPVLERDLPDLLCLFADDLETRGEDVLGFCARLREQSLKYRPVLVIQTGASEEKRMEYLVQGADDSLRSDLSPDEFKIRLLVHLRRNLDYAANELTKLPGLQFAGKVVQRRLNRTQPVALLLVELDHFDVYSEVYGELPARQVLKTFAALISRVVIMPDFISHTDENGFVIVTQPDRAEKIAALMCRQFDTVSPNFYSEKDRKQGYMISVISGSISRRVPLMSLSIGIAGNHSLPQDTFMTLFNAAQQMKALARMTSGSSWQSDRLRLAGASMPDERTRPEILVLESDAALAYLLKTTLEMEGYQVELASAVEDVRLLLQENATAARPPDLVILDALINEQETGLELASEIHARYPEIGIICTSSLHNRQRVLQAGVDLYLPKPFELSSLFAWVERLLHE